MRRFTPAVCSVAIALAVTCAQTQALRGESFSAGKNPAQLFASNCTGSGCHSGPQGLAKGKAPNDLAAYLRAHYTDSKQTAAALAAYLTGVAGEARTARGKPERIDRVERPAAPQEPQEPQDRAAREQREWLPFPLPNLFGRQEAQEPPTQQEATPPPARTPQRTRSAARPEQTARTPSERAAPSAQEETAQRSEGSLFSAFSGLFGRESETKAVPPEPAKPAPRTRQTSRQSPKDEEAVRPPARIESTPPPARRATRQPPKTEEAAKPTGDEVAPPQRARPPARQPPKSDAVKPDAVAKPPKPEATAKPPGDSESAGPPRMRQTTRRPPKTEEATAPVNTGTVPKRSRRTEPPFPITEDNAGPPPVSDIYRPARREPSSSAPGPDQIVAPGEVLPPALESGSRLQIFD
ncbi:MAG TPA: hypothetical protein VNL39_08800 [Xanthobacteraceae bacterium]|nr:hypothetical protein [Xanthobacteraceae bacterium]